MKNHFKVFTDTRMLAIFFLGFSSGLPLALTGATLQGWLTDAKIDIGTVGLFALVGLPYTMKFLWAPFMDSYKLPILGKLGLRRGWAVATQVGLIASIAVLGTVDPVQRLDLFSMMAFIVAFFSASQDIVVDAYRTEIIEKESYGAGAGVYATGYRVAMTFVSGGIALVLADHWSWTAVYFFMALLNSAGLVTILISKEPQVKREFKPINFKATVVSPFLELFQRSGAMEILIFVMIYKLSTLMATALLTKFLLDIGYTKTMIGSVNKIAGFVGLLLGTIAGGSLMVKFGLKKSLWIFGIFQSLVGVTLVGLIHVAGMDESLRHIGLVGIISLDNFVMGLGTVALMSFMMTFCNQQFTGTQLALFSSLTAVTRVVLVAHAGFIIDKIGWEPFFLFTVPLAIPGLLLLRRFDHWQTTSTNLNAKVARADLTLVMVFMASLIGLASDPLWRWADLKDVGTVVVEVSAFGVIFVILTGLLKPYLNFGKKTV